MSFKENTIQQLVSYFQISKSIFRTDPLKVMFEDFGV